MTRLWSLWLESLLATVLYQAHENEHNKDECAAILNQWADENLATTASHPADNDKEGKTWKDLWPLPEGSADPLPNDQDPLVKMIMNTASTQEAILESCLLLVNRVGLHTCSYNFLIILSKVCSLTRGCAGWNLEASFIQGRNCTGSQKLFMNTWSSSPDHPCASQHSSYQLQSWRANGDVSLILSNSSQTIPGQMTS